MRVVLQRVDSASVEVAGRTIAELDRPGLLLLVGVTHGDTTAIADRLAEKIWTLRILPGEVSAADIGAPILVVSQFTLYADVRKGRRPSWNDAAPAAEGRPLVEAFAEALRRRGAEVATGEFGAEMKVALVNDGPVTVILDSAMWGA